MALPKFAAVPGQEGLSPNSVQQMMNQNQKIAEIMAGIEARLSNITNVRSTVQSATFDAFGNNFLTRGAMQIGDSLTDSLKSLFTEPEKEKEDPILVAIREQTSVITKLSDSNSTSGDRVVDTLTQLRLDIKHNREIEKVESDKSFEELVSIKQLLANNQSKTDVTGTDNRPKPKFKKITAPVDIKPQESPADKARTVEVEVPISDIDARIAAKLTAREKPSESILSKILNTLILNNKHLDSFLKKEPMSTQEDDLEKLRKMQDPTTVTDIEPGQKAPKSLSFFDKLTDLQANLRGLSNLSKMLLGSFTSLFGGIGSLLKIVPVLGSALMSIVGAIGKVIAAIGGKAIDLLTPGKKPKGADIPDAPDKPDVSKKPTAKTPPVKGGGMLKNVAKLARGFGAAALITGGVMAADYVAGQMGVGGKEINEVQDDKNWQRASTWEKVQSAPSRVIEKVGGFIGAENISNEARANRIAKETQYLNNRDADLEKAKKEADAVKQKTAPHLVQPNIIDAKTVNNNQTIMPTRTIVENSERSFNRYLDSILVK